jgi:predicted DNA-binding protein
MTSEGQLPTQPKPLPPKKRYSILLSQEVAERFERVARLRHGAKSAVVEEALERRLMPEKYPLIDEALLRRLDEQDKSLATLKRDQAIYGEMLSLFVRYFLTITPPLTDREQQPARQLGRERFQLLAAQIGRRIASDRRLISEVIETITLNNPDLFATAMDDAPLKPRPASGEGAIVAAAKPNGQTPPTEKPDA